MCLCVREDCVLVRVRENDKEENKTGVCVCCERDNWVLVWVRDFEHVCVRENCVLVWVRVMRI